MRRVALILLAALAVIGSAGCAVQRDAQGNVISSGGDGFGVSGGTYHPGW
jgi:hypothetical protein